MKKKGIRKKIIFSFFIISILLATIISGIWYFRTSAKMTEIVSNYTFKIISQANDNFMITLKDIEYLGTTISLNRPNVIDVIGYDDKSDEYSKLINDRKLDDYISSIYAYKYYITGISITTTNGRNYSQGTCSLISYESKKKILSNIKKDSNKILITAHSSSNIEQISSTMNKNVITVTTPIKKNKEVIGMVEIDCNYDMIKTLNNSRLPINSKLFVIDKTGKFIYNSTSNQLYKNITTTEYKNIFSKLNNNDGSFFENVGKNSMFVVYHKSIYTNWITVGIVPKKIMLKEPLNTFRTTTIISLIFLMVILLVAVIISFSITKNVEKLRNAMESVKNGNLKSSIVINSNDEIEDLSDSFNAMLGRINRLMEDVSEGEKQKRLLEIKTLQAQINPHFLANTLNTIKWLADIQRIDNISNLTDSVIELLNVSIGRKDEFITIGKEIEYIKHYINIQQYKYCDKFKVDFEIEDDVINHKIPRLLLQPVLENAILHGIDPMNDIGIILMKIIKENDNIYISIRDNGIGMTELEIKKALSQNDSKKRFSNIGLRNVDQRIKLYYGEVYGVNITSVKNSFTEIKIVIPCAEGGNIGND
ncbi:sensor histidine kinase [Clostridium sp.]|uniref:sensor histidine kinase n=1 Tax=Clostridium sp. TaxID=1506 RepID=UPI003D6CE4B2